MTVSVVFRFGKTGAVAAGGGGIMCGHSLAASVGGGSRLVKAVSVVVGSEFSRLVRAVRRLLASFSSLAKLLGICRLRVIMCGHSLAASVGEGSRLVKAVSVAVGGEFSLLPKAVR